MVQTYCLDETDWSAASVVSRFRKKLDNLEFSIFQFPDYPGNIGSYDPYSVLSWKYWIVRSIYQSYPGNSGSYDPYISPLLEILDRTIHTQSYPGNSGSYDPYISPILEIVDRTIHICSYVDVAGGRRGSATFSIILEILKNGFFQFSPILEIVDRRIHISVLSWKYWIVRSTISTIGLINSEPCSI